MKHLLQNQKDNGFAALILLCILQLSAYRADAQEQNLNVNNVYDNVNINQSRNVRNINVSVPLGPNGPGGNVYIPANANIPVIDNGTGLNTGGPNVRGYTSTIVQNQMVNNQSANKPKTPRPAAVQAAKPKRVVAAAPTAQRPKPKPKTTVAAPKRTVARSAAPVVAAPVITAPAVATQVHAPVSNPVIGTGNESPVVEQMINEDNNMVQSNVMSNVSVPVIATVSAPAVRSSAASAGSGSSGKSHRSGRKKHGSFYYNTNKKMMKLFAKTKSKKFDPAKCFVWK